MQPIYVYGYASVFHVLDAHQDRVMPGAFTQFLHHTQKTQRYPPILYQHDPERIVGHWTHMHEDDHGLWVEGVLSAPGMSYQKLGLSIGYTYDTATYTQSARLLRDIMVQEVSLVSEPANPLTYAEFK